MATRGAAEDDGILKTLARLTALAQFGYRPFMQKIGELWVRQVEIEFLTRTDPYGSPWKRLAAQTVRKKRDAGMSQPARQLFATGELSQSFFFTAGPKRTRIESKLPELAAKHNYGGVPASGSPFRIVPARQILPEPDDLPPDWTAGVELAFNDLRIQLLK